MTTSPLGRYADDSDDGDRLHRVQLLNLPVQLVVDGRDRHDSLLREFALLAMDEDHAARTPRFVELTELLGVRYGAAQRRPDAVIDEAVRDGLGAIDVTYVVPASVVAAAERLDALMAEADEFCRTEQLLTLPRTPLQKRFAGMERLTSEDIADAIAYVVTRPRHVAINEILVRPTEQDS